MTLTTEQFRNKLEALDRDDLEGFSDMTEALGVPLLAFCDRSEIADETISTGIDLAGQACRAVQAIMRGESLEAVHAHISDGHSGATCARALLSDLHAQLSSLNQPLK